MDSGTLAAAVAAIALIGLSGLHIYWGFGGRWPAANERGLVETVVGSTPDGRMPGLGPCLAVAALLSVVAVLPLISRGFVPAALPEWLVRMALWGAAAVLTARGAGGFLERRFRPEIAELPYDRLNRYFYSPLCFALAGLLILSLPR